MSFGNPVSRPSILARTGSKSTNQDLNSARASVSQRRVHPPVQLDLVVQRAEDVRDAPLVGKPVTRNAQRPSAERSADC